MTEKHLDKRIQIVEHYSKVGIRSRRELARLAAAIVGRRWMDQPLCPNHPAPFDWMASVYFRESSETLVVAPRGSHKTRSASLLNAIELLTKPALPIVHIGAAKDQARRAIHWTEGFLSSPAVKPLGLVAHPTKQQIIMKNEASVEITAATLTGLNSAHAPRVNVDEFELIKPEMLDEVKLLCSSLKELGYLRTLLYLSSRKFDGGNVDSMLKPKNRHVKRFIACWRDTAERCPETRRGREVKDYEIDDFYDPEEKITVRAFEKCGECELLPVCRGDLARAHGVVPINDLIEELRGISRGGWLRQMESISGKAASSISKVFVRKRHVCRLQFDPEFPLKLIIDFGGGTAPTAILFFQLLPGHLINILAEYVKAGLRISEDVGNVLAMLETYFKGARVDDAGGDSASPDLIGEWNMWLAEEGASFVVRPIKKKTKPEMIADLLTFLSPARGETRYRIAENCPVHIQQMSNFKPPRDATGRIRFDKAKEDDTVDCALYIPQMVGPARGPNIIRVMDDPAPPATGEIGPDPHRIFSKNEKGETIMHADRLIVAKLKQILDRDRD